MDSLVEFLLYSQGPVPYIAAFTVLLICGLGVPIPEDITLFAMGLVCYYGLADFKIAMIVCLIGVLVGDSIIYFIGRKLGGRMTRTKLGTKLFPPERMAKTEKLFLKWGNKVIFAARFMPGLRAPTYFSAGTLNLPFRIFLFYDGLAALLSVPLLIGAVYYFGDHFDRVIQVARKVQGGIALLIAGVVILFVIKHFVAKAREK